MDIDIKTSTGSYRVYTGRGMLDRIGECIPRPLSNRKAVVVTDDVVAKLYLKKAVTGLGGAEHIIIAHGEASKTWAQAGMLLDKFASLGMSRGDCIIALGGGVIGDLTGFAASVYMRGVEYIQVPTTLLAGIDSSVGGKTAVDLTAGKNLAGRIYPPAAVIFDPDTLITLPRDEFANGMGEGVKYAVLGGSKIFEILDSGLTEANLEEFVSLCIYTKKRIVEADENENGERRLLNLGHTVGHAIELESGYKIPHGPAVAAGLAEIANACRKAGMLNENCLNQIKSLTQRYCGVESSPYPVKKLIPLMGLDKKRVGDIINMVTIHGMGDCRITPMSTHELEDFFSETD